MAGDEKQAYEYLAPAPIPSYEEATSSRPSSSNSRLGPEEISDDAERQGLLGDQCARTHSNNYAPPTVESARSSFDSLDGLGDDEEEAEVRREMQEMDMDDPADSASNRSLLSDRFKRFTSFASPFQSFSFPSLRRFLPSWRMPKLNIDWQSMDQNRAVILGRLVGIFIIGGLMYVLIASDIIGFNNKRYMYPSAPDRVRSVLGNLVELSDTIPHYLQRITQYPHLAGTEGNYILGEWIQEEFKAAGLRDVHTERFDVYLNYPIKDGRSISIVEPDDQKWQAELDEVNEETLVFHGLSKTGDVTGPLIYANHGTRQDFDTLKLKGTEVNGSIVLIRNSGPQPHLGLKVKAAELAGAIGCVVYSDPAETGALDGQTLPDGPYLPADGVQRGSTGLRSWVVGDPLTPGRASLPGENSRLDPKDSEGLVRIPSLPVSWRDAQHLLRALENHGEKLTGAWVGDPAIQYWTGSADSPKVRLANQQDEGRTQPIYNMLGTIPGFESANKRIVIGAHRDAWCGGAAAPGSGTAVMLEVVRLFGELLKQGWGPLRTIQFASWDGGEYNLMGSTEHVESRRADLEKDTIAYINLDAAISGPNFHASGSPLFESALKKTLSRIGNPTGNGTLYENWNLNSDRLKGPNFDSDYVPFQHLVGVPSIDFEFSGHPYPRSSCYDNYDWMVHHGDPQWIAHKTMALTVAYFILELSDHALVNIDLPYFGESLARYIDKLDDDMKSVTKRDGDLDLSQLRATLPLLEEWTGRFTNFDNEWHSQVYASGGFETSVLGLRRLERNGKLEDFAKRFLFDNTETQFRHVIYGPQKWRTDEEAYFTTIRDAMEAGDTARAQEEVGRVAKIITDAIQGLGA